MDLYEKLGVSKTATKKEIQSAYRRLSKQYHPDMQHGKSDAEKKAAEEKFKEISEAANILMDDDKRRRYDQCGTIDENAQSGFDPFDMFRRHFGGMGGFCGGFGDMFGFGGRGGMRGGSNMAWDGDDIQVVVNLTFKEAVNGCKKSVRIPNEKQCEKCNGTGNADGQRHTCSVCGGRGMEASSNGFIQRLTTCRACGGRGYAPSEPCKECHGKGVIPVETTKDVELPPGIETRNAIGISGLGKPGLNGGRNGNLIVIANVEQSELFERGGDGGTDVYASAYVTPADFFLGKDAQVIDPYCERVNVKIPCGFDTSKTLRVRGHGIRNRNGGRGDLYVRIFVCRPDSDDGNMEKEILKTDNVRSNKFSRIEEAKRRIDEYVRG